MTYTDRRRTSRRRFELIGESSGHLSILPAGSPMRQDRYRHAVTLLRVKVPRRVARRTGDVWRRGALSREAADQLKAWALFAYDLR